jgi:hypothetical protein
MNSSSRGTLIAVAFGRIDRPVTGVDGIANDARRDAGIDLPHPQSQLRDRVAIVEFDHGHAGHAKAPFIFVSVGSELM